MAGIPNMWYTGRDQVKLRDCRQWGRKNTMLLAGILFDVGVVLTAGALNIYMLMAGRVLLGVAVAFASVSVTLYNSEMAPAQLRGRLNQLFQVRFPHAMASWETRGACKVAMAES
jgi:MFS family permease